MSSTVYTKEPSDILDDRTDSSSLLVQRLGSWQHATAVVLDYAKHRYATQHATSQQLAKQRKIASNLPSFSGSSIQGGSGSRSVSGTQTPGVQTGAAHNSTGASIGGSGDTGIAQSFVSLAQNTESLFQESESNEQSIKQSVIPTLELLLSDLDKHIKTLSSQGHKGQKEVEKQRETTIKQLEAYEKSLTTAAQMNKADPKTDPYTLHRKVRSVAAEQIQRENSFAESNLNIQHNYRSLEQHIIEVLQNAVASLNDLSQRFYKAGIQSSANIEHGFRVVSPEDEWNHFYTTNKSLLVPEEGYQRDPTKVFFSNSGHEATVPLMEGSLSRKGTVLKGNKPGYYVLTPSGYLHQFKSADYVEDPTPEISLYIPESELGGLPQRNSGDLTFKIASRDSKKAFSTRHRYTFTAASYEELQAWFNALSRVAGSTGSNVDALEEEDADSTSTPASPAGASSGANYGAAAAGFPAATGANTGAGTTATPGTADTLHNVPAGATGATPTGASAVPTSAQSAPGTGTTTNAERGVQQNTSGLVGASPEYYQKQAASPEKNIGSSHAYSALAKDDTNYGEPTADARLNQDYSKPSGSSSGLGSSGTAGVTGLGGAGLGAAGAGAAGFGSAGHGSSNYGGSNLEEQTSSAGNYGSGLSQQTGSAGNYGSDLNKSAGGYGNNLENKTGSASNYGSHLESKAGSASNYGSDLNQSAGNYGSNLDNKAGSASSYGSDLNKSSGNYGSNLESQSAGQYGSNLENKAGSTGNPGKGFESKAGQSGNHSSGLNDKTGYVDNFQNEAGGASLFGGGAAAGLGSGNKEHFGDLTDNASPGNYDQDLKKVSPGNYGNNFKDKVGSTEKDFMHKADSSGGNFKDKISSKFSELKDKVTPGSNDVKDKTGNYGSDIKDQAGNYGSDVKDKAGSTGNYGKEFENKAGSTGNYGKEFENKAGSAGNFESAAGGAGLGSAGLGGAGAGAAGLGSKGHSGEGLENKAGSYGKGLENKSAGNYGKDLDSKAGNYKDFENKSAGNYGKEFENKSGLNSKDRETNSELKGLNKEFSSNYDKDLENAGLNKSSAYGSPGHGEHGKSGLNDFGSSIDGYKSKPSHQSVTDQVSGLNVNEHPYEGNTYDKSTTSGVNRDIGVLGASGAGASAGAGAYGASDKHVSSGNQYGTAGNQYTSGNQYGTSGSNQYSASSDTPVIGSSKNAHSAGNQSGSNYGTSGNQYGTSGSNQYGTSSETPVVGSKDTHLGVDNHSGSYGTTGTTGSTSASHGYSTSGYGTSGLSGSAGSAHTGTPSKQSSGVPHYQISPSKVNTLHSDRVDGLGESGSFGAIPVDKPATKEAKQNVSREADVGVIDEQGRYIGNKNVDLHHQGHRHDPSEGLQGAHPQKPDVGRSNADISKPVDVHGFNSTATPPSSQAPRSPYAQHSGPSHPAVVTSGIKDGKSEPKSFGDNIKPKDVDYSKPEADEVPQIAAGERNPLLGSTTEYGNKSFADKIEPKDAKYSTPKASEVPNVAAGQRNPLLGSTTEYGASNQKQEAPASKEYVPVAEATTTLYAPADATNNTASSKSPPGYGNVGISDLGSTQPKRGHGHTHSFEQVERDTSSPLDPLSKKYGNGLNSPEHHKSEVNPSTAVHQFTKPEHGTFDPKAASGHGQEHGVASNYGGANYGANLKPTQDHSASNYASNVDSKTASGHGIPANYGGANYGSDTSAHGTSNYGSDKSASGRGVSANYGGSTYGSDPSSHGTPNYGSDVKSASGHGVSANYGGTNYGSETKPSNHEHGHHLGHNDKSAFGSDASKTAKSDLKSSGDKYTGFSDASDLRSGTGAASTGAAGAGAAGAGAAGAGAPHSHGANSHGTDYKSSEFADAPESRSGNTGSDNAAYGTHAPQGTATQGSSAATGGAAGTGAGAAGAGKVSHGGGQYSTKDYSAHRPHEEAGSAQPQTGGSGGGGSGSGSSKAKKGGALAGTVGAVGGLASMAGIPGADAVQNVGSTVGGLGSGGIKGAVQSKIPGMGEASQIKQAAHGDVGGVAGQGVKNKVPGANEASQLRSAGKQASSSDNAEKKATSETEKQAEKHTDSKSKSGLKRLTSIFHSNN